MRKLIIACVSIFILLPASAEAQVVITEIMYDVEGTDTGREWIEVKNIGTEEIDLSVWKLFEANTNHKITSVGANTIVAGGFATIADDPVKFKADNPNYSGLVFDSAFSLNNTGETLVLRDQNGADRDSASYTSDIGATGDGNSLQKSAAGVWIAALPTPDGETTAAVSEHPVSEDKAEESAENSSSSADNSFSSHQSQSSISSSYEEPELTITSGRSRLGYVGVPIEFEAKLKKAKNVSMGNSITHIWSMGDGNQMTGQFISYTYQFPGEYIVIVNSDNGGVHAVSKSKVKIVEAKVSIKSADEKGIEIANLDSSELNIGGFVITTKDRRFVIPADTIISAKSSIKIPLSATKFKSLDEYVDIQTPRGATLSKIAIQQNASQVLAHIKADTLITLPEGVTLGMVEQRLENAVAIQESIKNSRVTIAQAVRANSSKPTIESVATSTHSQQAAVIYTEIPKQNSNWWGRIKAVFGR